MQNVHPLFVHFPIALLLTALALEVAWWIAKRDWLRNSATVTLTLGAAGAVAAAITGMMAGRAVGEADAAHAVVESHESFAVTVAALAVALAAVRLLRWDRGGMRWLFLVLLVALGVLLAWAAHLGGRLVYEFGVGASL
jgi:uncharacterized membrane protein